MGVLTQTSLLLQIAPFNLLLLGYARWLPSRLSGAMAVSCSVRTVHRPITRAKEEHAIWFDTLAAARGHRFILFEGKDFGRND